MNLAGRPLSPFEGGPRLDRLIAMGVRRVGREEQKIVGEGDDDYSEQKLNDANAVGCHGACNSAVELRLLSMNCGPCCMVPLAKSLLISAVPRRSRHVRLTTGIFRCPATYIVGRPRIY